MKRLSLAVAFGLLSVAVSAQQPTLGDTLNRIDTPRSVEASIGLFHLARAPQQGILTIGHAPGGTERLVIDGRDVRYAPDGTFAVGFDRDYAASVLISAFQRDGRVVSERLPVTARSWQISRLPAVTEHPTSDNDFQARRPAELAQIREARANISDAYGWRQRFIWPAHGRVSDLFGSQRIYGTVSAAPHGGVDVAIPQGTPILAPAQGIVVLAADHPFTLEGNLLMVDHGMGVNSAFLHLSKIIVTLGQHVHQGELIGYSGMTGRATGPHLHWAIKWNEERVDPQSLVGAMH